MSFPCPNCSASKTQCYDSRPNLGGTTRRRRKCTCGHRFTTYEMTAAAYDALRNVRGAAAEIITKQRELAAIQMPDIPAKLSLRPRAQT